MYEVSKMQGVFLFVRLLVSRISQKVIDGFKQNFAEWQISDQEQSIKIW